MFLRLLNPFRQSSLTASEVARPLVQKIYKSFIVLYTSPLCPGRRVTIDKYAGCVGSVNLWYVKLVSKHRSVYIPTSFVYDRVVEVESNKR